MSDTETRNAVIEFAKFDTERGLSAWIGLNYGGASQGFGGYLLYAPDGWTAHHDGANYAGHFIWRVLQIAEAGDWSSLKGRTVRARIEDGLIRAIGHIVKDDWFTPLEEFKALRAKVTPSKQ